MLHLCMTLAIISTPTGTTEALDKIRREAPQLLEAPKPPVLDLTGLGRQLRTPNQAQCWDLDGRPLGAGMWLPFDVNAAINLHLRRWDEYPARAQARIDQLVPRLTTAVVDVASTEQVPGHSTATVVLWTVGGIGLGVSIGVVLAVVAR